jgi:hypothetical protein
MDNKVGDLIRLDSTVLHPDILIISGGLLMDESEERRVPAVIVGLSVDGREYNFLFHLDEVRDLVDGCIDALSAVLNQNRDGKKEVVN